MKLKCTIPKSTPTEWIHLQCGKEFSRLLYTNPVCFLSTTSCQPEPLQNADRYSDGKLPAKKKDPQLAHNNNIERNVMVLSWLTASNNNGRFLFSIHKTRYSTQLLTRRRVDESNDTSSSKSNYEVGAEFSLSVPVKGMEEMVKDVGSISGRCCSKFQSVRTTNLRKECLFHLAQPPEDNDNLSNRQKKKRKKDSIKNDGIYDLIPVPLGSDDEDALREFDLFAIKDTVAHLRCRVYALLGPQFSDNLDATNEKESSTNTTSTQPTIDNDHLLIMGEVLDAYVNSSYWDSNKLLFRPMATEGEQTVPPYLTFFGSQTFGYVVPSNDEM